MPQVRKIIEINEELCDGCGQCIIDCAEAALELVDGKAKLVRDIFCDGLGACLDGCPTGALKIIEREADAFDEEAVEERLAETKQKPPAEPTPLACGCPGSAHQVLRPAGAPPVEGASAVSQLGQWPLKLTLLNPAAPFLQNADLLLLADCAGVSLPDLHASMLPGKAIALACPKLDDAQAHIDKLALVLSSARPRSLTAVIAEVPCCRGLEWIAQEAVKKAGLDLKVGRTVVARTGEILERTEAAA